MTMKFGFEYECFFQEEGNISLPPKNLPTDGFPGLVEFRSTGGSDLEDALSQLYKIRLQHGQYNFSRKTEHSFSGAEWAKLRKDGYWAKDNVDIKNLYGKEPRRIGNKTLASLQINISNLVRSEYKDDKGVFHPARYGLLDVHSIVKALDDEFKNEIKASNRQAGMYAIKEDIRLEYRSLPNSVIVFDMAEDFKFLTRIHKAIQK